MKVLTVHQPWAWLLVNGHKPVENRAWRTNFRGRLLIHSGIERGAAQSLKICTDKKLRRLAPDLPSATKRPGLFDNATKGFEFGAIIGSVDIVDCVTVGEWHNANLQHAGFWFAAGPFCWVCENAQTFDPIKISGQRGLWNLPPDLEEKIP